jgi:hypothetical protein
MSLRDHPPERTLRVMAKYSIAVSLEVKCICYEKLPVVLPVRSYGFTTMGMKMWYQWAVVVNVATAVLLLLPLDTAVIVETNS